jgi:hypothetical protein
MGFVKIISRIDLHIMNLESSPNKVEFKETGYQDVDWIHLAQDPVNKTRR